MLLKVLGFAVLIFFAVLGVITAVDIATAGNNREIIGGSPVFQPGQQASTMLGGRIVRFPPFLQQGGRRAAALDDDYYFCAPASGDVVRIPRGFVTDFASIPPVGRILIDRFGRSLEPATVHDWLYAVGTGTGSSDEEKYRAEADGIFLNAMADNGVGLATRWIMYEAVHLFGKGPYDTSQQWDGRLLDPETGKPFQNDIPRPTIGIVDHVDCTKFQEQINRLVGCYSTDTKQLFDADDRQRFACGPGDGVIVPR